MPYPTNDDLPDRVRSHLPSRAQDLWRATFNAAWRSHADDPRREEIAARIAWTAVKRRYVRVGAMWEPKAAPAPQAEPGRQRPDAHGRASR